MHGVLALSLAVIGQMSLAHPQAIPLGASLRADQIGHAFDGLCSGGQPLRLVERAQPVAEGAFGMIPTAGSTETRAVWTSADGALTLTVEASALRGSCALSVPASVSGDGVEIRQSLDAHLPRQVRDVAPEMLSDGVVWRWERGSTHRAIAMMSTQDGHLLRYSLER